MNKYNNTCLVVIDAQESFRVRDYYTEQGMTAYLEAQNALIEGALQRGIRIARVFHCDGPAVASNPWSSASGLLVPMRGLIDFKEDIVFKKNKHSALVNSPLHAWLQAHGIGKLLVSGIRSEQCCETTTRHASDTGYEMDYVASATHTWDMQFEDGTLFAAAEVKARTCAVLKDRFARIASVELALG
jgi:nicotinamidase-related amidase